MALQPPSTSTPPRAPDDAFVTKTTLELLRSRIDDDKHLMSHLSLYMRRLQLGRLLSLYDAYKSVADLPGSVVELGVFKGETLLYFAKLMELMNVYDRAASVIGFDTFQGFPSVADQDGGDDAGIDRVVGGYNSGSYLDELRAHINVFDHDRLAGHKPRIELVQGDIAATVPDYVQRNPGLRIKILHLDADLYEPTLVGLTHLYPLLVKGGMVILDEYGFKEFPGESKAVEEYFGDTMPTIRKFPFHSNPGGYFVK